MPPVLIAFFIMVGSAVGIPAVKGLTTPQDPTARPKWGEPAPQEYRTWTSRPWLAISDPATRRCDVTYFALATRNRTVRLVAGEREQLLDWSWSFERRLAEGERRTIAFEFRDPEGGGLLSCQEQSVVCYGQHALSLDGGEVREGRCRPDAAARSAKGGKPRLVGYAPPFTMSDSNIGGAFVDVTFEVQGTVTEDWYCPRIEVRWPDDTVTKRESDCPPFEQRDPEQRFRWKFNHGFPGGTWKVKACLYRGGETLACEEILVRVVGDESATPFMGENK